MNDVEFEGRVVDPTPRDNYTLAGRAANIPTPETDEETALLARHRLAKREWWAGAGQG